MSGLDETIRLQHRVIEAEEVEERDNLAIAFNSLANSFGHRYEALGNWEDFEKSIHFGKRAVEQLQDNHHL